MDACDYFEAFNSGCLIWMYLIYTGVCYVSSVGDQVVAVLLFMNVNCLLSKKTPQNNPWLTKAIFINLLQ